jgi:protein phosphatase
VPWRWLIGAVAAVVVAIVAFTAFRSWLDGQWYVGVANGHVAIYQGIPAAPFGVELSHVDEDTGLDAAAVLQLGTFPELPNGINVDTREEAQTIVDTMQHDLRQAQREQQASKGGGSP